MVNRYTVHQQWNNVDNQHLGEVQTPNEERQEIGLIAAAAVGEDYLSDPAEEGYSANMGKRVHFP
jgi:hypothetical protein